MCQKGIKLTKHAEAKIKERQIKLKEIEKVIRNPELIEEDRVNSDVVHMIGKIRDKYLRVIVRKEENNLIVISAFYDRRVKRGKL